MKSKLYSSIDSLMFCPNCHRQIKSPVQGNLKVSGKIRILCSCGGGMVIVKGEKIKEIKK
jgi:hypothetical protein